MTAGGVPIDVIIPDDKVLNYLLLPREENDKSKFLNSAGYYITNCEILARDLRQLIQANEVSDVSASAYGKSMKLEGFLTAQMDGHCT